MFASCVCVLSFLEVRSADLSNGNRVASLVDIASSSIKRRSDLAESFKVDKQRIITSQRCVAWVSMQQEDSELRIKIG